MSENSGVNNKFGPDFFGFYTSEVAELLSQDEGLLPFPNQISPLIGDPHEVNLEKGSTKNSYRIKENNYTSGSAMLNFNGMGAQLPDFKMERLRSLLRQSVFYLTQGVDEMINPVLSICRLESCLKSKESLLRPDASAAHKAIEPQRSPKKLKVSSACSIDDDLRFILESDSTKVEALIKKYSAELSNTLVHMEQRLEELLNTIMASCRTMTPAEKQQLRKSIQNLPPKNLDRIVENH